MNEIIVYSKNKCPQCKMLKQQLERLEIKFTEINTDENKEALEKVKAMGFKALPVTSFSDGTTIQGFRPKEIKEKIGV